MIERFTAARLMPEIALHFPLDALDWAIYSLVLIPKTRAALHLAEHELGWMDQKPAWGPGRDDAFNLPKFILTQTPWDKTHREHGFPGAVAAGATARAGCCIRPARRRASMPSSRPRRIGIGSLPTDGFEPRNEWIEAFIAKLEPPPFPGRIDPELASSGERIFAATCAGCHAENGARTGTAIPLAEIGTDPEHVLAWRQQNADRMNAVVRTLGARRSDIQGAQDGYVARPLVGVWLLGPYLHNGAVPTLSDLLSPPEQRPRLLSRLRRRGSGESRVHVERTASRRPRFRFDATLRGNGNGGHDYGTGLSEPTSAP